MMVRPPSLLEGCKLAFGEVLLRLREWWRDPARSPELRDVWERTSGARTRYTVIGIDTETGVTTVSINGVVNATLPLRLPVLRSHGEIRLVCKRSL